MEATSFQVVRREGTARRGELRSSSKLCATPACLLYTRKGSPQNMPVDLAASLVPALEALYLTAGDVYVHIVPLLRWAVIDDTWDCMYTSVVMINV